MKKKNWKILKKWIIENIELDLSTFSFPLIKKATEENIKKAIKQQGNPEKGSCVYDELQDLKEDLVVFKIVKSEDKRHFPT